MQDFSGVAARRGVVGKLSLRNSSSVAIERQPSATEMKETKRGRAEEVIFVTDLKQKQGTWEETEESRCHHQAGRRESSHL